MRPDEPLNAVVCGSDGGEPLDTFDVNVENSRWRLAGLIGEADLLSSNGCDFRRTDRSSATDVEDPAGYASVE